MQSNRKRNTCRTAEHPGAVAEQLNTTQNSSGILPRTAA